MKRLEKKAQEILSLADVEINGSRPWDIQVHNKKFYKRVLTEGSLGLGESYMDGWWDTEQLDEFFTRVFRADLEKHAGLSLTTIFHFIISRFLNMQKISRAFIIGQRHYDIGNDLYQVMLDKRLTYTCAYWPKAKTLDQAQEDKLDLVCRKIGLKPGQKVLDIGCGWGSFAKFAAEKYKAKVVGITVSERQVELGKKLCQGLPVEIRLLDYRKVKEKFDHIVSLGMFEHVGVKNYRTYMKVAAENLKDGGLFLLHTIGGLRSAGAGDAWVDKYIFPNSMLPSIKQIGQSIESLFVMEDWHNFGPDYDKTLMAWFSNFDSHWNKIKNNYSPRFYRMWKYYLLLAAGTFRSRVNQLWQIVFSKNGVPGGYKSIR